MVSQKNHNKQHGDTVPKKTLNMCLCTLQINILKSALGVVQYYEIHVDYLRKIKSPPSCRLNMSPALTFVDTFSVNFKWNRTVTISIH